MSEPNRKAAIREEETMHQQIDRLSYFDNKTICDNCRGTGKTWAAYAGKWCACGRCHGTGEDPRITGSAQAHTAEPESEAA
jgi:DnaJ-class molecular chaperone